MMNRPHPFLDKAIYASVREAFWFMLFVVMGTWGCVVALLADLAGWCEDKLRDALNAIEDQMER